MLKVKDLGFSRGTQKILESVSIELPQGELMALLGSSGCGKTTLLRLIAGFEKVQKGSVLIRGKAVATAGLHQSAYDRRVGFVFQNYALFPHMTVYENITFGVPAPETGVNVDQAARDLMELFGISHLKNKLPYQISGGEQQRVAIARAMVPQPELLLLDEPLAHLDSELRMRMVRELKARLKSLGVTCILVTHSQKEAFEFCDRLLVMTQRGGPYQIGTPVSVYERPRNRSVAEITGEGALFNNQPLEDGGCKNIWGEWKVNFQPQCQFFVRPEKVVVGSGTSAVVKQVIYRGHEYFVELESLESGEKILMSRGVHEPAISVGEKIQLSLRGEGAWFSE